MSDTPAASSELTRPFLLSLPTHRTQTQGPRPSGSLHQGNSRTDKCGVSRSPFPPSPLILLELGETTVTSMPCPQVTPGPQGLSKPLPPTPAFHTQATVFREAQGLFEMPESGDASRRVA